MFKCVMIGLIYVWIDSKFCRIIVCRCEFDKSYPTKSPWIHQIHHQSRHTLSLVWICTWWEEIVRNQLTCLLYYHGNLNTLSCGMWFSGREMSFFVSGNHMVSLCELDLIAGPQNLLSVPSFVFWATYNHWCFDYE